METDNKILIRRMKRAGLAFAFILVLGATGYHLLVPGTSWFDGLYMTFLTVTTIGFSEVVNLEGNVVGRIFTICIAIGGIGILTFAASNLAAFIIENDFSENIKRKRMEKEIAGMKGHYLICGASKVGIHIADELEKTHRPFVIADLDENVIRDLHNEYSYGTGLVGDCTDEEVLEKMNLAQSAGVFVTTRDDHNNIVICVTARQLKPDVRIISHCKEPASEKKLRMVGADKVISPSFIGGLRMASEMVRPTVTSFLDEMLRDTSQNLRVEEIPVSTTNGFRTIADLPWNKFQNTLLLAVREGDSWKFNPPVDRQLSVGSRLIVMTSPEELIKWKKIGIS